MMFLYFVSVCFCEDVSVLVKLPVLRLSIVSISFLLSLVRPHKVIDSSEGY